MRRLVLSMVLSLPLLGACGEDEKKARRAVSVQAGSGLKVTGTEYSFSPANVVVTGGRRLTVTLANKGSLAHNLRLERDGREAGGTPTFQGGRSRSGTVALEPGRYRMVCTVGDHERLGMVGTLEIR